VRSFAAAFVSVVGGDVADGLVETDRVVVASDPFELCGEEQDFDLG
jgi:hypothetical protein